MQKQQVIKGTFFYLHFPFLAASIINFDCCKGINALCPFVRPTAGSKLSWNNPVRMVMSDESDPIIQYRPLLGSGDDRNKDDEKIVWQMLLHAAHETDMETIKSNPRLASYARDFGQQSGDFGIVALAPSSSSSNHSSKEEEAVKVVAVGAAWIRNIPGGGYATSHLKADDPLRTLPELAIACLPEYRGKGIGSSLLTLMIQSLFVTQKQTNETGTSRSSSSSSTAAAVGGICLSCREGNPAMRLYERIGFVKVPGSEQPNRAGGLSITMKYTFDNDDNEKQAQHSP